MLTAFLWLLVLAAAIGLAGWWVIKHGIPGGRLDCGCPSGGAVYGCMVCGFTRCVEHRYDAHDCNEKLAR